MNLFSGDSVFKPCIRQQIDNITVIAPLPSSMNANEVLQNRPSIYVYVLAHL